MTKVSVVIPTYNRRAYLVEAISSAKKQNIEDMEIIVVDDGSNDGTRELFEAEGKFFNDSQIKYFFKENEGLPAKTRNEGIKKARGEYIAFLDGDDAWKEGKLQAQIKLLESKNDVALVCTMCEELLTGKLMAAPLQKKSGRVFWSLVFRNFIVTSSVMIRRKALDQVGLFLESSDFKISEDYDLWLRLSKEFNIHYIDRPLTLYRMHGENISADYISNLDYADRVIRKNLNPELNSIFKNKILSITPLKKALRCWRDVDKRKKYLRQVLEVDQFSLLARALLILSF